MNKDFLETEEISKLLIKLAIPTVIAQIINMLYNVVDRIYIGHIHGSGALALTGVGVCMPIIMTIAAFASLISTGGAPRASIFLGERNKKYAEYTLGSCFSAQIIVSIVLTVILLLFNRPILMLFGASENTIPYALAYMNIYAIGTIFVQLTLGMNMFITAQGYTKISMASVAIGAISNILLDPLLIYGFNMGVRGAAIATIISQFLSFVWVMHFLLSKKNNIKLTFETMKIRLYILMPAMFLGLSGFVIQVSESLIAVSFNYSLLKYGGDIAVGAMTILASVMQLSLLPLSGVGQGAQPIMSFNYGAKNLERVTNTFWLLVKISFIYSMIFWLMIMLQPKLFIALFTSDKSLINYTIPALRIYMGTQGLFGIQIACQTTFNSLGKSKESITVAVMRKIILLIPLMFILPSILPFTKTTSVYVSEPIADFLSVMFTIFLFKARMNKIIKL